MVASAMQLFRERGVAGTALSDVVEHSGAPRGSIYHYFPDGKAQLAAEATARAGHLMDRVIRKSMSTRPPAEALETIIEVSRKQLRDTDFTAGCPVAAGALEGGGAPEARAVAGEWFGTWERTLTEALRAHGVPPERANALATTMVCAIEGAIVVAKAQRSTRPLDQVSAELARMVGYS
jgi:AcrR family transcriptional regulator